MTKTFRYLLLVLILAITALPTTLQAQQKHDVLRKKYLAFTDEKYDLDSALLYSYKVRDAAIKEYGKQSMPYFRALNNIGYVYDERGIYDSARLWWLQCYNEFKNIDPKAFLATTSFIYSNLKVIYSYRFLNADSAVFFTNKYIDANRQLKGDTSRTYLNLVGKAAADIEQCFGYNKAAPFYLQAQNTWEQQFGTASIAIIKGIDSVLSSNSITNTVGRRRWLYQLCDTAYSVSKLALLFTKSSDVNDFSSIKYATEIVNTLSKNKNDTGIAWTDALSKLAKAYYSSINEQPIAIYLLQIAINNAAQRGVNDSQYIQLIAAVEGIKYPSLPLVITKKINNAFASNIVENTATVTPKLILPISHPQGITFADFSPDEKYVISKSFNDLNAKLWHTETGKLIYNLTMENGIWQPRFTKDNQYIITHNATEIDTWHRETGKKIASINSGKTLFKFCFLPDSSNTVASVDTANNIQLWDAVTGKLLSSASSNMSITSFEYSKHAGTAIFYAVNKQQQTTMFEYNFTTGNTTLILQQQKLRGDVHAADKFVTFSGNKALVFDRHTYKLTSIFDIDKDSITSNSLTPKGDKLLVCYNNNNITVYNTLDGDIISDRAYTSNIENVAFIGNGNSFILRSNFWAGLTTTSDQTINYYFDGDTLSRLNRTVEPFVKFAKNKQQLLMVFPDNVMRIWQLSDSSATLQQSFKGETKSLASPQYIAANKQILVSTTDAIVKMIDPFTGKTQLAFADSVYQSSLVSILSHNTKYIAGFSYYDSSISILDVGANKIVKRLACTGVTSVNFSNDDKLIVTTSANDNAVAIWDWQGGKKIKTIKVKKVRDAIFGTTDKTLLLTNIDSLVMLYNLVTNRVDVTTKLPYEVNGQKFLSRYTHNNQYVINIGLKTVTLLDGKTLKVIRSFDNDNQTGVGDAVLTKDAKRILMGSYHGLLTIKDVATGDTLQSMQVHGSSFSPFLIDNDKLLLTVSEDATIKVWDFATLKFLYQVVPVSTKDYIVIDAFNHYDGTEAARKLLYFTCGTEVIGLEQVKDQLWVPRLAERILNGETIDAPALADLNICGLTPLVSVVDKSDSGYKFSITPRSGGLGETILYVNGIEAKRYASNELSKVANALQLQVSTATIKDFFIAGKDNTVTIKAYTAEKSISSRGVGVTHKEPLNSNTSAPNVYAIMVGVSDYKGEKLDLNYAAKDANDLSKAIATSARKLLNTNGSEHVFVYNLTAEKNQAITASKKRIKDAFAEIATKAKANDILLIFFAGHGVMEGEKKQFYFLTADASDATIGSASVADVGISTTELSEWMQPQLIKAQKRVLIFDACNSGQAITELVAVRDDKAGQQVKAIEKLNEKSGLFILSASASNQSAYEMGQYSQGLLTYTLLKAMKDEPDILEDNKYLNVSRWFNAAEKNVGDIVKETGNRQQPQIVSTTNFNIGIVDQEVMASIILPTAKPLFAASNFQNSDEAVADDNLELSRLVNSTLSELASRGLKSTITYAAITNSPDAYSLSGRYDIAGQGITVKVNIKYHKAVIQKFEIKGAINQLEALAKSITDKASSLIENKVL